MSEVIMEVIKDNLRNPSFTPNREHIRVLCKEISRLQVELNNVTAQKESLELVVENAKRKISAANKECEIQKETLNGCLAK
jgi:predicted RNase H-like nuclease (RuvC/YqgF family)